MKNIISKSALFVAMLSLLLSCEKSVRTELPSPEDQMNLNVSKESVEISFFSDEQTAVSFSWDESGYAAQGRPVRYAFKMDISGNNFETSIPKIDVTGVNTISFSPSQLKGFLDDWKIQDGTRVMVEAEVIATLVETESIENQKYEKPEVSKVTFDLLCVEEDIQIVAGGSTYSFVNNMTFVVVDDVSNVKCVSGSSSINVSIPSKGLWYFGLDYENRKINYSRPEIWMLGDADANGWWLSGMPEMVSSDESGKIKKWNGILFPGTMKFPLTFGGDDYSRPYLMPMGENAPLSNAGIQLLPSGYPDYKWEVKEEDAGEYNVTLDIENMTISFEKICSALPYREIWICGSATSAGWEANPFPLKLNYDRAEKVFVFDGHLTPGEFKFPLRERTFEIPFLMPTAYGDDGLIPLTFYEGNHGFEVVESGGYDHKWKIEDWEEGDYVIKLDTRTKKLTSYKK
ncbi:MAG: SusE domain-containing protein [Candidatus Cryptobacteroides sp.]